MFTMENESLLIKAGKNPDPLIVSSADDAEMRGLYNFTTTEMAAIFNDMLAFLKANGLTEDIPAPVKRFADKIVGAKRIRALRPSVVATLAVKAFGAKIAPETAPAPKARKAAPAAKAAPEVVSPTPTPEVAPAPPVAPAITVPSAYEVKSLKEHPLPKGTKADTGVRIPFRGYTPWAVGEPWTPGDKTITRIGEPVHHPDVVARWSLYSEGATVEATMKVMAAYMGRHPALKYKNEKQRRNQAMSWIRSDHKNGRVFVEGKDAEWGVKIRKAK